MKRRPDGRNEKGQWSAHGMPGSSCDQASSAMTAMPLSMSVERRADALKLVLQHLSPPLGCCECNGCHPEEKPGVLEVRLQAISRRPPRI